MKVLAVCDDELNRRGRDGRPDHDPGVRTRQSARNEIDKGLIASVRRRRENESLP